MTKAKYDLYRETALENGAEETPSDSIYYFDGEYHHYLYWHGTAWYEMYHDKASDPSTIRLEGKEAVEEFERHAKTTKLSSL